MTKSWHPQICQQFLDVIGVSVSLSIYLLCSIIQRNGQTLKKVQQMVLQQSPQYHSAFMNQVTCLSTRNVRIG